MPKEPDKPARKRHVFNRRLRPETVHFNGLPVKFYFSRKKRRWTWRAFGGHVQIEKAG